VPGTAQSQLPFSVFLMQFTGASLLFVWLYERTGGSVPVAVMFHAAANLAFNVVPVYPQHAGAGGLAPRWRGS
jgi:uncharacterized protein